MTKEQQNRILVLFSIIMYNGKATKNEVLNYLDNNSLILLSENDTDILESRNELKWRNELAFTRSHLVKNGYLDNRERNFWSITDKGVKYYYSLKRIIVENTSDEYSRLTEHFLEVLRSNEDLLATDEAEELFKDNKELRNETTEKKIKAIKRYKQITDKLKQKYLSKCQIESCGFTFKKINGEYYSEGHHLIPLSQGGSQDEENVVILCANHHRMLHYADVEIKEKEGIFRIIVINGKELRIKYQQHHTTKNSTYRN
jgi:predicted restriction endonuclease